MQLQPQIIIGVLPSYRLTGLVVWEHHAYRQDDRGKRIHAHKRRKMRTLFGNRFNNHWEKFKLRYANQWPNPRRTIMSWDILTRTWEWKAFGLLHYQFARIVGRGFPVSENRQYGLQGMPSWQHITRPGWPCCSGPRTGIRGDESFLNNGYSVLKSWRCIQLHGKILNCQGTPHYYKRSYKDRICTWRNALLRSGGHIWISCSMVTDKLLPCGQSTPQAKGAYTCFTN